MRSLILLLIAVLHTSVRGNSTLEKCTELNCNPPDCRCSDWGTPGNLSLTDTPQFISLTFDNHFNTSNFHWISEILNAVNDDPQDNKCPVVMTFFVSHLNTDYALVNQLFRAGHEIGVHTISHPHILNHTYEQLADEILGQRDIIRRFARIPKGKLQGVRMPYLEMVGDAQFELLKQNGFTYEFSRVEWNVTNIWPYTLDFASKQSCLGQHCPMKSYPGFWQMPIISCVGSDQRACKMIDDRICTK